MDVCRKCLKNKKISFFYCGDCLKIIDPLLYCEVLGDPNEDIIINKNTKSYDTLNQVDFNLWIKTFSSYTSPESIKNYPSYRRIRFF